MKTKLSICHHTLTTAKQAISHRGKRTSSDNVTSRFCNRFLIIQSHCTLAKCILTLLELNWKQHFRCMKTKLSICHHTLTTAKLAISHRGKNKNVCANIQRWKMCLQRSQNNCFSLSNANLWRSCSCRRRGCWSSLIVHLLSQNLKLIVYGCTIWTFRFCYCLFFVISSLMVKLHILCYI